MDLALWTAKSGADVQNQQIAIISNNLANANTVGFKTDRADIEDLPYQVIHQANGTSSDPTQNPSGLMAGTGAKLDSTEKIFTSGSQLQTNNQTDVSINGNGFLQVTLTDGSQAYTRDGQLRISATGELVTADGYPLDPNITIPANTTSVAIGPDGTVSATLSTTTAPSIVGKIQLANFTNYTGLLPIGNNLYKQTTASGSATLGVAGTNGLGTIQQGSLESSNSDVVGLMVDLIEAQRGYEMCIKAISTSDQMMKYANDQLQA